MSPDAQELFRTVSKWSKCIRKSTRSHARANMNVLQTRGCTWAQVDARTYARAHLCMCARGCIRTTIQNSVWKCVRACMHSFPICSTSCSTTSQPSRHHTTNEALSRRQQINRRTLVRQSLNHRTTVAGRLSSPQL